MEGNSNPSSSHFSFTWAPACMQVKNWGFAARLKGAAKQSGNPTPPPATETPPCTAATENLGPETGLRGPGKGVGAVVEAREKLQASPEGSKAGNAGLEHRLGLPGVEDLAGADIALQEMPGTEASACPWSQDFESPLPVARRHERASNPLASTGESSGASAVLPPGALHRSVQRGLCAYGWRGRNQRWRF